MTCAATLLGEHVYREFRLLDRRGKPTARELRCACGARPPDPEAVLAALSASEAALRGQRLEAAQLIAQQGEQAESRTAPSRRNTRGAATGPTTAPRCARSSGRSRSA